MIPVYFALKKKHGFKVLICVSAQQREMLDGVLKLFEIKADYDLDIMEKNQSLYMVTSKILLGMETLLHDLKPDIILVHGDTTTSFVVSLAAFYQQIPVGHVEAGLRTGNIYSPWPEEANRRITAVLATLHFAPTEKGKLNLLKENIPQHNIFITGNTVIDALFYTLEKIKNDPILEKKLLNQTLSYYPHFGKNKIILITGHRRENFGQTFIHICEAIKKLAQNNPSLDFIYPVHLNPHVQKPVKKILSDIKNVYLLKPLSYELFIYMMDRSYLILTDSGGIQEEAPSLGKPVLVMRNETERPEAVKAGTVKLIGTEKDSIYFHVQQLIDDKKLYNQMQQAANPYGEGNASVLIADHIERYIATL